MMSPLVSVIMPVYNQEPWVGAAVKSVLLQSYSHIELIVIDDESSDATADRVAQIQDARLRLIRTKHLGFVPAMNVAIRQAQGEWIARMDGDDIAHPYRLERQLAFLDNHPDAVTGSTVPAFITPSGCLVQGRRPAWRWQELTPYGITSGQAQFSDPGTVFHRQTALDVGLYDTDFEKDTSLWYRLLREGKGYSLSAHCYFYRFREGAMTLMQIGKDTGWAGVRKRYDPEGFSRAFPGYAGSDVKATYLHRYSQILLISVAGKDLWSTWRCARLIWKLKPGDVLLFRRLLLEILGRETLKIWKWSGGRMPHAYEPYVPENQKVAEILTELGVKLVRPRRNNMVPVVSVRV